MKRTESLRPFLDSLGYRFAKENDFWFLLEEALGKEVPDCGPLVRLYYVGHVPNIPNILAPQNRRKKRLPTRPMFSPHEHECRFGKRHFEHGHHRLDWSEASFQSFRGRRRTPSTWDCWRTTGPGIRLDRRHVRIDNVLSATRQNFVSGQG